MPGLRENRLEILLRLPNIFADNLGDVHFIHLHIQLLGHHLGAHGLPRAGRAGKEDRQAPSIADLLLKAPETVHLVLVFDVPAGPPHQLLLGLGHDHVVPGIGGGHEAGQRPQLMDHLPVTALVDQRAGNHLLAGQPDQPPCLAAGQPNLPGRKTELCRQLLRRHILPQSLPLQERAKQRQALPLRHRRQLQLHHQGAQPRPQGQPGQQKPLAPNQLQPCQGLHQPLLRGRHISRLVPPLQMVQAQTGPRQIGGQGRLLRQLPPVLPLQVRKDAPVPAAAHQMLHLEPLAAAVRAAQADAPLLRTGKHPVQPPGCLHLHRQRSVRAADPAVKERPSGPVSHSPRGQKFHRRLPQDHSALRQLLRTKQSGEAVFAGEAGHIVLHALPLRQKQLHRQVRPGGPPGHIVLQVREEFFIFAVQQDGVGQDHAALLELVQAAPRKEPQQRQGRVRPPRAQANGLLGLVQPQPVPGGQPGAQPRLGGPGQIVLKFLP